MSAGSAVAILTQFQNITDPRMDRTKRHNLLEMIVIALCAAVCGSDHWVDVERFGKAKLTWFRRFLELPHGIPSHDTFGRVFAALDTEEFLDCMIRWLQELSGSLAGQQVAIDGKTLRRSFDRASGKNSLHVVSAWSCGLRMSLGQVAVDDKSCEITAVPQLLELLELTGAVVTLDAMHSQTKTAAAIRRRGADYILPVKANQPSLHNTLIDLVDEWAAANFQVPGLRKHRTVEQNHGRREERVYYVAPVPAALRRQGRWKDIDSVGVVYRSREVNGMISEEITCFISSLPPKVRQLAKYLRGHWAIENSLHWTLDVTFAEDDSRIRLGNGPEIASMFRRLALTILKQDTTVKDNVRGKRLRAGWENAVLEGILTGFQGN